MEKNRVKEHIVRIGLLLFILLPTLMGTFMASDLTTPLMRFVYLISGVCFYAFFLVMHKQRTFFYIASAFLFFSAIEIVHLIINHATISILFVWTIVASERGEFFELLSAYWIVVVAFIALWVLYFRLVKRYIPQEFIVPSRRWRYDIGAVIAVYFVFAIVALFYNDYRPKWLQQNKEDVRTTAFVGAEKFSPVNMVLVAHSLCTILHDLHKQQDALENYSFGLTPDYNGDDVVVLLIGETSRYDHWQINGYERQTSPRLAARGEQIITFDSCYTIANLTTICVPFMLSPATPNEPQRFYNEKSVVEAFDEAGFHTAWIADQSFGNSFLQRIARTCEYCYYPMDNQPEMKDTVLLAPFSEVLNQSGKQLIVLHSLGCHFKYSSRYTDEYRVYTPDLSMMKMLDLLKVRDNKKGNFIGDQSKLNELRKVLVNSYDNGILYTDFIVDTVISMIEQTNRSAVLVYVGDHGENLLDDERNMFLHGTYQNSKYESHVPLFVWMSDKYQLRYPEQATAVKSNTHKTFSTMTLFHSLLELGQVPYSGIDTTESFANPALTNHDVLYGLDANLKMMEIER